jgi:hypothetical protein
MIILSIRPCGTSSNVLHAVKCLPHGTFPLYFPSERKVCCGSIALAGFWTRKLWVQWPAHYPLHHRGDVARSISELLLKLWSVPHLVGLPGRRISPIQGLYVHRTAQHKNTRKQVYIFYFHWSSCGIIAVHPCFIQFNLIDLNLACNIPSEEGWASSLQHSSLVTKWLLHQIIILLSLMIIVTHIISHQLLLIFSTKRNYIIRVSYRLSNNHIRTRKLSV